MEEDSHSSSPSTLLSRPSAGLPNMYLYTCVWTNWSAGIKRCSLLGSCISAPYSWSNEGRIGENGEVREEKEGE
jgi:hypothetical protein